MPTFRQLAAPILCGLVLGVLLGIAPQKVEAQEQSYASAKQAYRLGMRAHRSGNSERALPALTYAAGEGVLGAQLKLAEMFETGNGVDQNKATAFQYYQQIADAYAETSPRHPVVGHIAGVFIKLAEYHARGIEALNLESDLAKAAGFYLHAASYFGDPRAQYQLAKLHLAGEGVEQNPKLAVNWLANASRKRHAPSQALLGDLLWRGSAKIRRQPVKGLALLALARRNARGSDVVWIGDITRRAQAEADPDDLAKAQDLGRDWAKTQSGHFVAPTAMPTLDTADTALGR